MFIYYVFVDVVYSLYVFYLMAKHRSLPARYVHILKKTKNPVVLISGIGFTWAVLISLGDYLLAKGYPVYFVPDLGNNLYSIPHSARIVKELIKREAIENVVLFGHSKGGLIAKYLMAYLNGDGKVLGSVSFATPYSGSILANFSPFRSSREFRPKSEIILKLAKETKINKKIISLMPTIDTVVWGKNKSFLAGALDNQVLKVNGHIYPIFSKELFEKVAESIERISKLDD